MGTILEVLFDAVWTIAPLAVAVAAASYTVGFEVLLARAVGTPGPGWRLRADRGGAEPPRWEPGTAETTPPLPMVDRVVVLSAAVLLPVVVVGARQANRGVVLAAAAVLVSLAVWVAIAPVAIVLTDRAGEVRRRHRGLRDAAAEARLLRDLIETGGDLPDRWRPGDR